MYGSIYTEGATVAEFHPMTSRKRAKAVATALFLLSLAVLVFTNNWWPGIMLALGIPLALKQFLMGRTYDAIVTLLVFVGTFVTVQFDISWQIFLPILFALGALYILLREFFGPDDRTEEEKEEELNHELEEKKKK